MANLSEEILSYFQKNPEASDSLEGITNWWMGSERRPQGEIRQQAAAALQSLVHRGLLEVVVSPAGARYKLRRRRP